jgi:hypothetical protein
VAARGLTVVAGAAPGLRQGAVYRAAPIFWLPDELEILRPPGRPDWTETRGERWADVPDRFRLGDRVERVVAHAKMRPVVVVASASELGGRDPVRVVPLYSYNPGSLAERRRSEIEGGAVSHALHVRVAGALREGYVNLREASLVPRAFFRDADHAGDLAPLSLAALLRQYASFLAA